MSLDRLYIPGTADGLLGAVKTEGPTGSAGAAGSSQNFVDSPEIFIIRHLFNLKKFSREVGYSLPIVLVVVKTVAPRLQNSQTKGSKAQPRLPIG